MATELKKRLNYSFRHYSGLAIVILLFQSCRNSAIDQNADGHFIDDIVAGKLAYNIPDTMRVGSSYRATVSYTKALNESILFFNLDI
jgi:hypothetical protein